MVHFIGHIPVGHSATVPFCCDTRDGGKGHQTCEFEGSRRPTLYPKTPKLPIFSGQEDWKIWFTRFEETAERRRWSVQEKMDQLLPLIVDDAAEFVYGELTKSTRMDYFNLITELNGRFRVIETRRSCMAKFRDCDQRQGGDIEAYAADLKEQHR